MADKKLLEMLQAMYQQDWQVERKQIIQKDFKFLLMAHAQHKIGDREFHHQLHDLLKILKKEKSARPLMADILKEVRKQNKKIALELRETDKQLETLKANLKEKSPRANADDGYATYNAVKSMMREIQAMRQLYGQRSHLQKGKDYQKNIKLFYKWGQLEDSIFKYWDKNNKEMLNNPEQGFAQFKTFLESTQNNLLKNETDSVFKNFIKSRFKPILNAPQIKLLNKINFDKASEKADHIREKLNQKCDELGGRFAEQAGLKKLIAKVVVDYKTMLNNHKVDYESLLKKPHAERDYRALEQITATINRGAGLINVLTKNLMTDTKVSHSVVTQNLFKGIQGYLQTFEVDPNKNTIGQFAGKVKFYNDAVDLLKFIREGNLLPNINRAPIQSHPPLTRANVAPIIPPPPVPRPSPRDELDDVVPTTPPPRPAEISEAEWNNLSTDNTPRSGIIYERLLPDHVEASAPPPIQRTLTPKEEDDLVNFFIDSVPKPKVEGVQLPPPADPMSAPSGPPLVDGNFPAPPPPMGKQPSVAKLGLFAKTTDPLAHALEAGLAKQRKGVEGGGDGPDANAGDGWDKPKTPVRRK